MLDRGMSKEKAEAWCRVIKGALIVRPYAFAEDGYTVLSWGLTDPTNIVIPRRDGQEFIDYQMGFMVPPERALEDATANLAEVEVDIARCAVHGITIGMLDREHVRLLQKIEKLRAEVKAIDAEA
jgi:hypothetical protein